MFSVNMSGKFSKQNTHRKDGLTVFAELNMGGELCKKDKLSSICDASSVSYFYFVLFNSYSKKIKKKGRACVLI